MSERIYLRDGPDLTGEALHARRRASLAQRIEIEEAVGVGEEDRLASVAALGDVVRDAGDYDAGEAGHGVGEASKNLV